MTDLFYQFLNKDMSINFINKNVVETNEMFELQFALPGLTKEDIEINRVNDKLQIVSKEVKSVIEYLKQGFNFTNFKRTYTIPSGISSIKSKYANGVLYIQLYKAKEAYNKIEIE